jgi:hypothetical protein
MTGMDIERHVLFSLEEEDEAGCIWACSWAGPEIWRHNLGPAEKVREVLSQWLMASGQSIGDQPANSASVRPIRPEMRNTARMP